MIIIEIWSGSLVNAWDIQWRFFDMGFSSLEEANQKIEEYRKQYPKCQFRTAWYEK